MVGSKQQPRSLNNESHHLYIPFESVDLGSSWRIQRGYEFQNPSNLQETDLMAHSKGECESHSTKKIAETSWWKTTDSELSWLSFPENRAEFRS